MTFCLFCFVGPGWALNKYFLQYSDRLTHTLAQNTLFVLQLDRQHLKYQLPLEVSESDSELFSSCFIDPHQAEHTAAAQILPWMIWPVQLPGSRAPACLYTLCT